MTPARSIGADLGATWTRFDHDVSINSTLMIIAASAQTPDRVYCAAAGEQVFGTEDGGGAGRHTPSRQRVCMPELYVDDRGVM